MEIFKAYDIRGIYPIEINKKIAKAIGYAYSSFLKPKKVALGYDVRKSSPELFKSLKTALLLSGVNVIDIGAISTEMLYFVVGYYKLDGGIIITASHNPREYNGMKLVQNGSRPIFADSGLKQIEELTNKYLLNPPPKAKTLGLVKRKEFFNDYKKFLFNLVDPSSFKKLKVVTNANFGYQHQFAKKLLTGLPIKLIPINGEPDGNFPKGRPDPFVPENRDEFLRKIIKEKADFGVAWDADADRCFFATNEGQFIEAYYMNAIFAKEILKKYPKSNICYDTRYTWAIIDEVKKSNGKPVESRVGHSYIKEKMRKIDAVFCGESSGHYYFKDFFFTDSGMLPFLLVLELISKSGKSLKLLTGDLVSKYFVSGEMNFVVKDAQQIIEKIKNKYSAEASKISELDKLSMEFDREWRFNTRTSNTEPLLRLNVEGKSKQIVNNKVKILKKIIEENNGGF